MLEQLAQSTTGLRHETKVFKIDFPSICANIFYLVRQVYTPQLFVDNKILTKMQKLKNIRARNSLMAKLKNFDLIFTFLRKFHLSIKKFSNCLKSDFQSQQHFSFFHGPICLLD